MASVSTSDLDPQLDELVDAIIASYENNDAEGYLRVFAPGAAVWLSYLNDEMSAEQNASVLTQIFASFVGEFRYENMRRHRTSSGYVQQYDLTIVAKSGATLTIPACQVGTVNSDGLVERLEEYLDAAIMAFGQEQAELAHAS